MPMWIKCKHFQDEKNSSRQLHLQQKSGKTQSAAGRLQKLSPTAKRALVWYALMNKLTARKIQEKTNVNVSLRTVQRVPL